MGLELPHSSILAWKIPRTEEPGRLQSTGLRRIRHDWATSLSLFTFMHWRRKWQATPVFLPGESQGRGSLVGCIYGVTLSWTRLKWLSSSSSSSRSSDSEISLKTQSPNFCSTILRTLAFVFRLSWQTFKSTPAITPSHKYTQKHTERISFLQFWSSQCRLCTQRPFFPSNLLTEPVCSVCDEPKVRIFTSSVFPAAGGGWLGPIGLWAI